MQLPSRLTKHRFHPLPSPPSSLSRTRSKHSRLPSSFSLPSRSSSSRARKATKAALALRQLILAPPSVIPSPPAKSHRTSPKRNSTVPRLKERDVERLKTQLLKPSEATLVIREARRFDDVESEPMRAVCLDCIETEAEQLISRASTSRRVEQEPKERPRLPLLLSLLEPFDGGLTNGEYDERDLLPFGLLLPASQVSMHRPLAGALPSPETLRRGFEALLHVESKLYLYKGPSHAGIHPPMDRLSIYTCKSFVAMAARHPFSVATPSGHIPSVILSPESPPPNVSWQEKGEKDEKETELEEKPANHESFWDPNLGEDGDEAAPPRSSSSLETDSPYAEVRASVHPTDSDSPTSTLRSWTLGILFSILLSGVNQFFFYRYPNVQVSGLVAQLLVHPLGLLLSTIIKKSGRWNEKEHALSDEHADARFCLFWLPLPIPRGSRVDDLAEYAREYCALQRPAPPRSLARIRPEIGVETGVLLPQHPRHVRLVLLPLLSLYWSFLSWIKPDNQVVNLLFGYSSGAGMSTVTFDWGMMASINNPLATPWWSTGAFMIIASV
ncbi:hypothetical protein P7C73_g1417, partial [Tremellales sp. Uapishka_1]